MQALISTLELRLTGYRVAQTSYDDQVFPVAETMFWVDFPDDLNIELVPNDFYWYDPADEKIKPQDITES